MKKKEKIIGIIILVLIGVTGINYHQNQTGIKKEIHKKEVAAQTIKEGDSLNLVTEPTGTYYYEEKEKVKNEWLKIEENIYYFGSDGKSVTGVVQIDGDYYNFNKEGFIQKGVIEDGYYYGKITGKRQYNYLYKENADSLGDYYFGSDGKMIQNSELEWEGNWYYFGEDGKVILTLETNAIVMKENEQYSMVKQQRKEIPLHFLSSNEEIVTVDDEGKITGIKEGTAVVTAQIERNGTIYQPIQVEVRKEITDFYFANIDDNKLTIIENEYSFVYTNRSWRGEKITWESRDEEIATVDDNGKITGIKKGTTTITAKINNQEISLELTVEESKARWETIEDKTYYYNGEGKKVTGLKLVEDTLYYFDEEGVLTLSFWEEGLIIGKGETANVIVEYQKTDKKFTFESVNEEVAVIDDEGNVTGISPGETWIYLTIDGITKKYLGEIKVENSITSFEFTNIEKEQLNIKKGETYLIETSYAPLDTTDDTTIIWESSNEKVATVDEDGRVTARKKGKTEVTATIGRKSITATITVTEDNEIEGWQEDSYYIDGEKVTGVREIEGQYYYFNEKGILQKGVVYEDYYYGKLSGTRQKNYWLDMDKDDFKETYFDSKTGAKVLNDTLEIDGKWYYFKNGKVVRGESDGIYYYGKKTGTRQYGYTSGDYYYGKLSGTRQKNYWKTTEKGIEYFGFDGKKVSNGEYETGIGYCYFDKNGYLVKGKIIGDYYYGKLTGTRQKNYWKTTEKGTYYFGIDGKKVSNKEYETDIGYCYFDKNGYLVKGKVIGDYYYGKLTGTRQKNYWLDTDKDGFKETYFDSETGAKVINDILEIDGKWYYFKNGKVVRGDSDGTYYYGKKTGTRQYNYTWKKSKTETIYFGSDGKRMN